jgi:UTP--glucose-1-phosphate uridylyltransferase
MKNKITKAIITAAGRGTRFLPASKAFQKEMVPLMNKPQLQRVIEEAMNVGITDIAVVVREGVRTLQDYLEKNDKLWQELKAAGKEDRMDSWIKLKERVNLTIFEQRDSDPYGNGTPFILAREFIDNKPFVAMWGDDLVIQTDPDEDPCLKQMMDMYDKYQPVAIMQAQKVDRKEISRYGSFAYFDDDEIPYRVKALVEKPEPDEAPSLMANACRFILTPKVLGELSKKVKGKDQEIWLTEAVDRIIQKNELVLAPPIKGNTWCASGDPIRWLKANLTVALHNEKFREGTLQVLDEIKEFK